MEYEFATPPFSHQHEEWNFSRELEARAILWEQGTGKSKLTLDTVGWLYLTGKIDCLIVLAPGGVHLNWVTDEVPKHLPPRVLGVTKSLAFRTTKSRTKWHQKKCEELQQHPGLAVATFTYDSLLTEPAKDFLWELLQTRKVFIVADESHKIKNPSAERTKVALAVAEQAAYRRILTGTPVSQGPLDLYSQLRFLNPHFWVRYELSPYTVFKNHFGTWKTQKTSTGKKYTLLTGYRRLGELNQILQTCSSRKTKEEVLDLPKKLYTKRYYELSPEQERMYADLKSQYMTFLEEVGPCHNCEEGLVAYGEHHGECPVCEGTGIIPGGLVTAPLAIVRMLRLQQVCCGFLPADVVEEGAEPVLTEIPGSNPRLELLADIVEEIPEDKQFIIFSHYTKCVDQIVERLKKMNVSCVRYDGQLDEDQRAESKRAFLAGEARVFVANTSMAAEGLTFVNAKYVIYYTNSYRLLDRLQSEDRAHRIGQDENVQYIDLAAYDTIDVKVIDALLEKFNIAVQITGDKFKEWLQ